jgi:hypothetical protein
VISLFIGHFVVAFLLIRMFPQVPSLVFLLGVGFPDILWPLLIFLKVEKASVEAGVAGNIKYSFLPYSHSLIISSLISAIVGVSLAVFLTPLTGLLFVVCSASHWFLDTVVHLHDLPVLGFGHDKKVGFGLWRYKRAALIFEFGLYAISTLLLVPFYNALLLLVLGLVFTLPFAGSGSGNSNSKMSIGFYASMSLVGFVIFAVIAYFLIGLNL